MIDTFAVVAATIVGPLAAVAITLWYQKRQQKHDRKLSVFRSLMQWRGNWLHADWVGAINMVPVEFAGHSDVLSVFTLLIDKLGDRGFAEGGEQQTQAYNRAETAFIEMLQKIARHIRIDLTGFDLRGRVYAPTGWWTEQQENQALRSEASALLSGRKTLRVSIAETE